MEYAHIRTCKSCSRHCSQRRGTTISVGQPVVDTDPGARQSLHLRKRPKQPLSRSSFYFFQLNRYIFQSFTFFLCLIYAHLSDSGSSMSVANASFTIDFPWMYEALCNAPASDQTTLLLYLLIHCNANMRSFIISRADIEQLVGLFIFIQKMAVCSIIYFPGDSDFEDFVPRTPQQLSPYLYVLNHPFDTE